MIEFGHSSLANASSTLGWILAHLAWLSLAYWTWRQTSPGRLLKATLTLIALSLWILSLTQLRHPDETDVNRYFFEGVFVSEGLSPYRIPPARFEDHASQLSPEALSALRAIPQAQLNFPELGTPYPPLQEASFGLLARAVRTLFGQYDRFAFLVGMVLTSLGLVLYGWKREGIPFHALALYACHPLLIREWGLRAHADGLMVSALLAALSARTALASTLWAWVAMGLKYPGAGVAWFVKSTSVRGRFLRLVWVLLFAGLAFTPFLLQAPSGTSGAAAFTTLWESNSGLHRWLRQVLDLYPGEPGELVLRFGMLAAVAAFSFHLVKRKELRSFEQAALGYQAFILISPTPNPWYFTWVFAFLPLCRASIRNPLLIGLTALPLAQSWWAIDWVSTWSAGGWIGAFMRGLQNLGVEPLWNLEHVWLGFWTWKAYRSGLRLSHVEQSQR